mgnify:CR=1 FL=1
MTTVVIKTLPDNNLVISIDNKRIFCRDIITELYETHDQLTLEDINWAIPITCEELLKGYQLNTAWDSLIYFLLYATKTLMTGSSAYIYNYELDDAITSKNINKLLILINLPIIDRWQEVTKSMSLTEEERQQLMQKSYLERVALINLVTIGQNTPTYIHTDRRSMMYQNNFSESKRYLTDHSRVCDTSPITSPIHKAGMTIYESCLEGVCIEYNRLTNQKISLQNDIVLLPNKSNFNCYERDVLFKALLVEPTVDPITKQPFPLEVEKELRDRYKVELKLYKFYLDYLRKTRG